MTYYYGTKTYSFTGFTEADLLQGKNGTSINCGDVFKMPSSATVCINVTDDDRFLSGDRWCNENADDHSGQTAHIEGGNGNGRQIYAEQYHILKGSDGHTYYLIEIEQEGSHETFFTFYGNIPADGVTLTVVGTCNVTSNWIDYTCLGAGEKVEPGSVGGRLFTDADHDNTEWNAETGSWEAGVDGARVELLDKDGNVVAFTTTDHYGTYKFNDVAPGDYKIKFYNPDGTEFVKKDVGHHGADSDANANGVTDTFHIASGEHQWNVDAGVKASVGTVSGTVFCDTNCDGINGEVKTVPGHDYTIEAEHMHEFGFHTVSGSHASGGKLEKLNCAGGDGQLWTTFGGKTGTYDVKLRIQDECDGQSKITLLVDGKFVEAIRLDQDDDGWGSDNGGFSTFVIKDVAIKQGDEIRLVVDGDKGEWVRFDKIDLIGQDQVVVVEEPVKEGVTVKLLDKDGKVVATTTTDADGNYSFDKVPVGQYKVMGVAPDGTEFTIKDAGTDDTIDSDVGADGKSDLFTVTSGQVTDIDLGVCDKPEEPGSLSGRYFCDDNRDGLDNDGPGKGIAGVRVELLDAAGNGTGISTTTDANGNYSFGGLTAGTYGVKFTDTVSGKVLTTQNVDGDASDDIDSDAEDLGGGMSQITGIVVVAGQDTADNDAGVFEPNTPPEANADSGKTCVTDAVTVDVLGNDMDADGDTLTVTAVNGQAIAEGGSVVIDGVTVSLVDGELVFDGSAAADLVGLNVGQQEARVYSYTISDGTDTATADVTVTYCGSAETIEELNASLPAEICFQVVDNNDPGPSTEAFTLKLSGSGDARFDGVVIEQAYCLSNFEAFLAGGTGSNIDDAPLLKANIYVADKDLIPSDALQPFSAFGTLAQVGINGQTAADNLDMINWILNQDFGGQGFTDGEIQGAIWSLTDGDAFEFFGLPDGIFVPAGAGDAADAKAILDLALANGEGFEAGSGDLVGLLIDPTAEAEAMGHKQPFIIAIAYDSLDCLC